MGAKKNQGVFLPGEQTCKQSCYVRSAFRCSPECMCFWQLADIYHFKELEAQLEMGQLG